MKVALKSRGKLASLALNDGAGCALESSLRVFCEAKDEAISFAESVQESSLRGASVSEQRSNLKKMFRIQIEIASSHFVGLAMTAWGGFHKWIAAPPVAARNDGMRGKFCQNIGPNLDKDLQIGYNLALNVGA